MRSYQLNGSDIVHELNSLYNLITVDDVHISGLFLCEKGIITSESADCFELIIKHTQHGKLFLVSIYLVYEFVSNNETVLVIKVVVFAVLDVEDLEVFFEGNSLRRLYNGNW